MDKRFEIYITKIVNDLDCNETEKAEIAEEMYDHLIMLKDEFQQKGCSEEVAINEALAVFGNEKEIGDAMQNSLFPYMKTIKLGGFFFCFLLAFFFVKEGISLMASMRNVDGAGIGVHFLLFEINDRVPASDILFYAIGFFIAGILAAAAPFALFQKKVLRYMVSVWT